MNSLELINVAERAMNFAYAPYSSFKVGAALLATSGQVYTGCNVENASFGVTNCAERTALYKAVSEGERKFDAIAIVGGINARIDDYCYPCGICRQALMEFVTPAFKIVLKNKDGQILETTLGNLLPNSFSL